MEKRRFKRSERETDIEKTLKRIRGGFKKYNKLLTEEPIHLFSPEALYEKSK
ncbi:hypothetical protein GCE9029_00790 [Grimontia celer]|uniref:Uncharacterized protein n=1 Tax=Grimontia celer TaxID=1796497 RepID=A0A128EUT9_9GAMM|nr:hypothetical protein [Grimontia celer]CZF78359.1 hypothetical protein GCE9029_00790 [Grimontia celer]